MRQLWWLKKSTIRLKTHIDPMKRARASKIHQAFSRWRMTAFRKTTAFTTKSAKNGIKSCMLRAVLQGVPSTQTRKRKMTNIDKTR